MAGPYLDRNTSVGQLRFHHSGQPGRDEELSIYPREQFDVGRQDIYAFWGVNELRVSTHHLRVRCGMYEDEGDPKVSPMVYVRVLSRNAIQLADAERNQPVRTVSRDHGDILLNPDDILQLTAEISVRFRAEKFHAATSSGLTKVQAVEVRCFKEQYSVSGRRLGVGGQASVLVAIKQSNGRQVACKAMPLPLLARTSVGSLEEDPYLTPSERRTKDDLVKKREDLKREYHILSQLDHPNIVRLEKVICATYNTYIFQDLITGGDLLSYLDIKGALSEAHAVVVSRQLVKAVEYLHSNGIVHRDIKPENILMSSWREGARILLTDFGQSRTIDDAKRAAGNTVVFRMQSLVGTTGYVAPEVLRQMKHNDQTGGYSKAVDIWSVGCVTGMLLTGDVMFADIDDDHGESRPELSIGNSKLPAHLSVMEADGIWSGIGRKAKAFVQECLQLDESQRLTAQQALLHQWFTNKHYAGDLEATYQRAIQDWHPREITDNLVDYIDTDSAVQAMSKADRANQLPEEVKSQYFHNVSHHKVAEGCSATHEYGMTHRHQQNTLYHIHDRFDTPPSLQVPRWGQLSLYPEPASGFARFLGGSEQPNQSGDRLSIADFAPPVSQNRLPLSMVDGASSTPTQSQIALKPSYLTQFTTPTFGGCD